MALPVLPVQGQNPWFVPRNAWDLAVKGELEGRLSSGTLDASYTRVNTLAVLAPAATGANQSAALAAAMSSAATFGLWLQLNGNHVITSQIVVPTGAKIDGTGGTITQTSNLTSGMRLNSVSGVRIRNLRMLGKTSDYVNTSGVWAASAVYIAGSSNNIRIENSQFLGWAGAGVYIATGGTDIQISGCKMVGPGASYITSTTFNYSGGVFGDAGTSNWSVSGCDISGFSQGVVTGDNLKDIRIVDNFIHDIPGQHGLYLETMQGAVVSNNEIRNCGILGMKIQIGTVSAIDAVDITISDNVFIDCGGQGILFDNPLNANTRFRRINITGNIITRALLGGIELRNLEVGHVSDNTVYESKWGIRLVNCVDVTVADCHLSKFTHSAVYLLSCQDIVMDSIKILNPGSVQAASDRFGVLIEGATSADLTFRDFKIRDTQSNMRYGVFLFAGDSTTMDFIGVTSEGATDYGWRMVTAGAVRSFRNVKFSGTMGAYLNRPTNFNPIANATDAASAITQLNLLLAVQRDQGNIPT